MSLLALLGSEGGNGFWSPPLNEVIWQSIAFVIVVGGLAWKAGPALRKMIAARPERIRNELAAAADARSEAEASVAEVKAALADSDKEAQRIIAEANETATRLRADIAARADADADAIRARGEAELAAARRQAEADLQGEVARLALGAAEKVVHANLSTETQQDLIERYIAQVGVN
ncbi:MAG: F0F1 ATP synthase subunit B [Microthrixaceae bacterium]